MDQKNSIDTELHVEYYVTLIHIPIKLNSFTDDLEINIDTRIFHRSFSQLDLGNATMQPSLETSVHMCS